MAVIALTGGIGSGKSEAANIFAELGVPVTDVDVISHQLTATNQPLVKEIEAQFGSEYITPDGAMNRTAMRDLVFSDKSSLAKLNAILHPAIYAEAVAQMQQHADALYQIIVIPLLFESPRYLKHINRILLIECDEKTQIARIKQRNQLSEAQIMAIINAQTPRQKRFELTNDVIENNENMENLRKKILSIHKNYINTCILSKTIS